MSLNPQKYKISVIGSGNLAFRLSIALKEAGHRILSINGRNSSDVSKLYAIVGDKQLVNSPSNIEASDIVIITVPDNAIEKVSIDLKKSLEHLKKSPVILHCSGSVPLSVLDGWSDAGVLYPLMTLSKSKAVDFKIVPFFIEYTSTKVRDILINICNSFGSEYKISSEEERLRMHIAAVFISNFVNYLASLSFDISRPNQIYLMPLAIETIRKAFLSEDPSRVQTGPAARNDIETIKKHLDSLKDRDEHHDVYSILTDFIIKQTNK